MSYIGNQPTSVAFLTDSFSGNGTTTVFTMTVAPATTSSILVSITGVLQDPSTYSVTGTTLTFSAAPPSGTGNISVRYLGIPASGVTTTAYRTVTEFTATAGQTTFSVPSYTVGYINVYRNGVMLGSADYTASNGTTVVLTAAASVGDLVTTESFYVSSVLNAIPATAGSVGTSYLVDDSVTSDKLASGLTLAGTTTFGGLIDTGSTGQIKFPATQNPSNDANTLDDYEEGTWTPVFAGSSTAGSCTYSAQTGTYVKVGRIVVATFDLITTSAPTGTGILFITGLPFTTSNLSQANLGSCGWYWTGLTSNVLSINGYGDPATTRIVVAGQTSASSSIQYVSPSLLGSAARLFGVCIYTSLN